MKSPIKCLILFLISLYNVNTFCIDISSLHINQECAISLVKASTAILPEFDSIGHHVLNANQVIINKILESNFDSDLKKNIILKVIDLTRQGDEMGGKILLDYYNFINYLL